MNHYYHHRNLLSNAVLSRFNSRLPAKGRSLALYLYRALASARTPTASYGLSLFKDAGVTRDASRVLVICDFKGTMEGVLDYHVPRCDEDDHKVCTYSVVFRCS